MIKEEAQNIIDSFNKMPSIGGTSLGLVDFDGNSLKVKLECKSQDVFKVQGKIVSFADEAKKSIEKYLKSQMGDINIIFV
ncbi:MAG: hypothetical protein NTX26_01440 [Candidatus Parcubacteria bacterium]|nr:hypothetical protein [Candidatus Parcubacteria bacterium]